MKGLEEYNEVGLCKEERADLYLVYGHGYGKRR
jgi:hypothetical protein